MRILLAEDHLVTRRILEARLRKWGDEVVLVADGETAWQMLQADDAPRLVLMDRDMPGLDGLEVCRRVRQLTDRPYTYILVLTGCDQPEEVIEGLEAGADDYLVKPANPFELRARLQTGRRIIGLQEELLAAQAALFERATHDPLTGLWNRAAILEALDKELCRCARDGSSLGVVLADLDHFKRVNDTHGHLAGDAVLRETARRMRSALRHSDWIGRYGGEEFLMVLAGCDRPEGVHVAERLRRTIAAPPVALPEGEIAVTISLGMVITGSAREPAGPGSSERSWVANHLLQVADAALYRAKQSGRNRLELGALVEAPRSSVAGRQLMPATL
jgi:diguanylate cyclase (GGDEF)-like protein